MLKSLATKTQPTQHTLDLVVQVIAVTTMQLLLQMIEWHTRVTSDRWSPVFERGRFLEEQDPRGPGHTAHPFGDVGARAERADEPAVVVATPR